MSFLHLFLIYNIIFIYGTKYLFFSLYFLQAIASKCKTLSATPCTLSKLGRHRRRTAPVSLFIQQHLLSIITLCLIRIRFHITHTSVIVVSSVAYAFVIVVHIILISVTSPAPASWVHHVEIISVSRWFSNCNNIYSMGFLLFFLDYEIHWKVKNANNQIFI